MSDQLLQLLQTRVSRPRLVAPAPSYDEVQTLMKIAARAPDHAMLRPWRYLVIQNERLEALGELFLKAMEAKQGTLSDEARQRFMRMPLRAPMIIVGIAQCQAHPKVPEVEQIISTGTGMGYMLVALQAMGYGGMWRTGELAYDDVVRAGLGLQNNEHLCGFLYVGTPEGAAKPLPAINAEEFCQAW